MCGYTSVSEDGRTCLHLPRYFQFRKLHPYLAIGRGSQHERCERETGRCRPDADHWSTVDSREGVVELQSAAVRTSCIGGGVPLVVVPTRLRNRSSTNRQRHHQHLVRPSRTLPRQGKEPH